MKEVLKINSSFLLRTPALNQEFLKSFIEENGQQEVLRPESIIGVFDNFFFREAIYYSSKTLFDELTALANGKKYEPKAFSRLQKSFMNYLIRMCTRSTPYGLMAGNSVGSLGDHLNLEISSSSESARYTRLSTDVLVKISNQLHSFEEIEELTKFARNNTVYYEGREIRFVESFDKDHSRDYKLTSIDFDETIQLVLEFSREPKLKSELIKLIHSQGYDLEDSSEFIKDLIDCKLLSSQIDINVVGEDYLTRLVQFYENISPSVDSLNSELDHFFRKISIVSQKLKELDSNFSSPNSLVLVSDIENALSEVIDTTKFKSVFHVELTKPGKSSVMSENLTEEVNSTLKFLIGLVDKNSSNVRNIDSFKSKFIDRFGFEWVPMTYALDPDVGLGYPMPKYEKDSFLNGLGNQSNSQEIKFTELDIEFVRILSEASALKKREVNLLDYEKFRFPADLKSDNSTYSFTALISTFKSERDGFQVLLKSAIANNPFVFLGRFTLGNNEINQVVSEMASQIEKSFNHSLIAEVNHFPRNSRIANVVCRDEIVDYQIPYLSVSTKDVEKIIDVSDLYLSVRNDNLVLWSKRLNKRIIPLNNTAHNYTQNSAPVYQFLGELEHQNDLDFTQPFGPNVYQPFDYTPRVKVGNVVIRPASWKFDRDQLPFFNKGKLNFDALTTFLRENSIPNHVLLKEQDRELYFDLSFPLFAKQFLLEIKGKSMVTIYEALFDQSPQTVKGPTVETYLNEIVLTYMRTSALPNSPLEFDLLEKVDMVRSNSDWIYVKVFGSEKQTDLFLENILYQQLTEWKHLGQIRKWFVVKYNAPSYHLRIRLDVQKVAGEGVDVLRGILGLAEEELQSGRIFNFELDHYRPEYDRYGIESMPVAEELFSEDTERIIYLKSKYKDTDFEKWQIGLGVMNAYLSIFSNSLTTKLALTKEFAASFAKEQNYRNSDFKKVNSHVRRYKKKISDAITNREITNAYENLGPLIVRLTSSFQKEKGSQHFSHLVFSVIHMSMNRLFGVNGRSYETFLYHLLERLYTIETYAENSAKSMDGAIKTEG